MDDAPVLHIYRGPSPAVAPKKPKKKYGRPGGCRRWTDQEMKWFVEWFPKMKNVCLASILGRTYPSIRNRGRELGLKKVPKKPKEIYTWRLGNRTEYKRFIKVDGRPIPYSRYQWEQLHGPIPPRHHLSFKDGDTMNDHPDNMELITEREQFERNRTHTFEERSIAAKKIWKIRRARQALRHYGVKL